MKHILHMMIDWVKTNDRGFYFSKYQENKCISTSVPNIHSCYIMYMAVIIYITIFLCDHGQANWFVMPQYLLYMYLVHQLELQCSCSIQWQNFPGKQKSKILVSFLHFQVSCLCFHPAVFSPTPNHQCGGPGTCHVIFLESCHSLS